MMTGAWDGSWDQFLQKDCARHRRALRSDWQRAQRNIDPTGRYDQ